MVEGVADRAVDDPRGLGRLQPALVLALELRLADEHRDQGGAAGHDVVGGERGGALRLADALGVILQSAQQRGAQAGLVRAAVRGRDRVAIGMDEAVRRPRATRSPIRPSRACPSFSILADEGLVGDQRLALDIGGEVVLEAAGKVEHRLGRDLVWVGDQRRRAAPADLDAAEQIGLRARHLEDARRIEAGVLAEDLRVGPEAHLGAAPVRRLADDVSAR